MRKQGIVSKIDGILKRRFKKRVYFDEPWEDDKPWIFGREIPPPRVGRDFVFFAAGSILLAAVLLFLGQVDTGLRAGRQILGVATNGIESLKQGDTGKAALNFDEARQRLEGSGEAFLQIVNILRVGRDGKRLLEAGAEITKGLESLNLGREEFLGTKLSWDSAAGASSQDFFLRLSASRDHLTASREHLSSALETLNTVNLEILPAEYRRQFFESRDQVVLAHAAVEEITSLQGFLMNLFGGKPKTYILIFQNNNEARATGGFIGTYGVARFDNGRIYIDKIESIYVADGQLTEKIAAPGPLRRQAADLWGMRDANWFVDFPASARKIMQFAEMEGGTLADGVISFTPDVFVRLLQLTGPVPMPEYGEVLTAENFRAVVQYKTSVDYDRELNQPKKFLADFAPRFLTKLGDVPAERTLELAQTILNFVSEKQILMFSLDPLLEEEIAQTGASGRIEQTDGDYLAIFHTNVGGGKTDLGIRQRVEKKVSFTTGGLSIVRLAITRTHESYDEKYFPKNIDFMRVLVPARAKLLSASGFDAAPLLPAAVEGAATDSDLAAWDASFARDEKTNMYVGKEAGYVVFANWLELLPGETKSVELVYEVPFSAPNMYTHLLQKQAGAPAFEFYLEITYMPGNIVHYYPDTFEQIDNKLLLSEIVNADRFYGLVGQ